MKLTSYIAIAVALCALEVGPAQGIVVHIGCDGDGVADSCSASEINDGGVVLVNLVTFTRNASDFFISTANTDGPIPSYTNVLISGDDSLPGEPALIIDDNLEHRVNSGEGITYSNVTFEFRLGLGGDLVLFGTYLEIDPYNLMTENVHLQAVLTVEGKQNEVILPGLPGGGPAPPPKSNVVRFSAIQPNQNGFVNGYLFLEALELTTNPSTLGAFQAVNIRWLVGEVVFIDGFENGHAQDWSQTAR